MFGVWDRVLVVVGRVLGVGWLLSVSLLQLRPPPTSNIFATFLTLLIALSGWVLGLSGMSLVFNSFLGQIIGSGRDSGSGFGEGFSIFTDGFTLLPSFCSTITSPPHWTSVGWAY